MSKKKARILKHKYAHCVHGPSTHRHTCRQSRAWQPHQICRVCCVLERKGAVAWNTLYSSVAKELLWDSNSISLNWDGASYGGLNLNIAFALDCEYQHAAHLPPTGPMHKPQLNSKVVV